jgi:hypothetical protein
MQPDDALYEPDGPDFLATAWTRGPWDPRLQHGGPPAALMLRAMERAAAEAGEFELARLTVEFLRAVPIGRCAVTVATLRSGRKALGHDAELSVAGRPCARARALFIRRADIPIPPELAVPAAPADPLAWPAHQFDFFPDPVGYHTAMDLRLGPGPFEPGCGAAWLRLRGRLVAGEDPSPAQRVAVAADAINGVGFALDFARFTFINADLTIYLHRRPEPPWVQLRTTHRSQPHGRGLVDAELADPLGPIGRALEAQVLALRDT